MAPARRTLALLACLAGGAQAAQFQQKESAPNPIRRVVDLLQKMQTKVAEEGKAEKKLFDAYMCYCKTGSSDLGGSINAAETKGPQVASALEQAKALKTQLEGELVKHKADRQDAKDTIAKATELREKEAATFAKDSSDLKTNVDALGKAVAALSKGIGGSFLQTTAGATLKRLSVDMDMSSTDRDLLSAFLSQDASYAPQSGAIVGIVKGLKDTAEKNLASLVEAEQARVETYKALVAAKEEEIEANSVAIESKLGRVGELGTEIVTLEQDAKDTAKALAQDQAFLADLQKNCATKQQEWDERSKTRAEELVALADTIKLLNDDEALDLFKETLPSASFVQLVASAKDVKARALRALNPGHKAGDYRLDLIALALKGKTAGFEQVDKLIDDMVKVLGQEQSSDDAKKSYCEAELDKAEDEKKILDRSAADLQASIEAAQGTIASLTDEIKALEQGLAELDKQVQKATEQRQAEHEEFTKTTAANTAAKDLLEMAKNRLAKFYTPKLYKAPPKEELSKEDRIVANMGGFVQAKAAPAPPPETWGAYQNKGEEHTGVVALIDGLKADLDKELQQSAVDEKNAQAEYERLIQDSSAKKAADSASAAQKAGAKADLEVELQKLQTNEKATVAEAMAKGEYIVDLHKECDWLLSNYAVRKEARTGEVDSLKKAKAVLAGADYSLVQTVAVRSQRLRGSA